jgi:putative toxin-antitoxin system antitoxin component (TIGR02293 family)
MATKDTKHQGTSKKGADIATFLEILSGQIGRHQDWNELSEYFSRKNSWVVYDASNLFSHYISVIGNLTGNVVEPSEPMFKVVRSTIKEGLPREAFDRIKKAMATTTEELSLITEIPARTIARRKRFKPDESERIFRVASVFQKVVEMHKDLEQARKWFTTSKVALSGLTPIECCDTEAGSREVENLLGRIDESVYS